MSVRKIMSNNVEHLPKDTSILLAAQKMRDNRCGFIPVSDPPEDKLCGVITDRDITIRAVAEGMDPTHTAIDKILSDQVLYCFADDSIESAANSMRDLGVYRLIVLDNPDKKRLCGIVSLGDIVRSGQSAIASDATEGIMAQQTA